MVALDPDVTISCVIAMANLFVMANVTWATCLICCCVYLIGSCFLQMAPKVLCGSPSQGELVAIGDAGRSMQAGGWARCRAAQQVSARFSRCMGCRDSRGETYIDVN